MVSTSANTQLDPETLEGPLHRGDHYGLLELIWIGPLREPPGPRRQLMSGNTGFW